MINWYLEKLKKFNRGSIYQSNFKFFPNNMKVGLIEKLLKLCEYDDNLFK